MKAFYLLSSFEGKSKCTNWLHNIVYNEALGRLRKTMNYPDQLVEYVDVSVNYLDWFRDLHRMVRNELIQRDLDAMKPTKAAILTLFYREEQSVKEIEEIMDLKSSQVNILLHRGRRVF